jgi:UDP-glucose 4-epimerase
MKYLVTGGAGFIGSNLVDKLIENGHEVIVIDNESSDAHDHFYWNDKAHNYKYDICDYEKCSDVFERHNPDMVFHIAAEARIQPCIIDPLKAVNTNVVGTTTILELCRKYKVKRIIYSSTSSAYGLKNVPPLNEDMSNDCLNPYSVSKTCGEELCKMYSKLYGMESIIFRYFNVYGERQPLKGQYAPVIGIFLRQNKANEPMTIVGDGLQRRDFTHVYDVVDANIKAANFIAPKYLIKNEIIYKRYEWGQVYNIGTGTNYSIIDIAKMIGDNIKYIEPRLGEAKITLADITKVKNELNWTPSIKLESWLTKQKNLL